MYTFADDGERSGKTLTLRMHSERIRLSVRQIEDFRAHHQIVGFDFERGPSRK